MAGRGVVGQNGCAMATVRFEKARADASEQIALEIRRYLERNEVPGADVNFPEQR